MIRSSILVLVVGSLLAVTGCGARAGSTHAASPVAQATETTTDPSWNPPEEMEVNVGDGAHAVPKNEAAHALHIPKQDKPHGVVHAATY